MTHLPPPALYSKKAVDQSLLTVIAPVQPGRAKALGAVLDAWARELPPERAPGTGEGIAFGDLSLVHFARFLLLEPGTDARGREIPPELVFSVIHDGPRRDFVRLLVDRAGGVLERLYAHCEGAPAREDLENYLLRRVDEPAAFFNSARWRTAELVRGEAALRGRLEQEIDREPEHVNRDATPAGIHAMLRRAVDGADPFSWALEPAPRPGLAFSLRRATGLVAIGAAGLLLLPVLIPALLVLLPLVRRAELEEQRRAGPPSRGPTIVEARANGDAVERRLRYSGYFVQNQLSMVSVVKPGRLRWLTLRIVIAYLKFRMAYQDTKGRLNGIPSVHFARWHLIDGGRRLLFMSDYDGTWEAYVGDFVDFGYKGLNLIWSNTEQYPPTRWWAFGGASSAKDMAAYVGSQQVECALWWAAYPDLSVLNLRNDIAIREGLADPTPADPAAWLQRF